MPQTEEHQVVRAGGWDDLREIYGELPPVARAVQFAEQSDHRYISHSGSPHPTAASRKGQQTGG